jgi:hypothetical protein
MQMHMVADLTDLTNASTPDFQAEFPIEELSESDAKKLKPGLVFRWAVGYQRSPQGTKMRCSQIVFRDLPQWTARELTKAADEANELLRFFQNNQDKELK